MSEDSDRSRRVAAAYRTGDPAAEARLLRIGVIGCGDFASRIIWPALRYAPVEVAYACARTHAPADRNRRVFGAETATCDVDEILADASVEAVVIVGQPEMHYQLGMQALAAGKHVFIEKPPGSELAQAKELLATAEATNVECQVALQKRYIPTYLRLREQARRGIFGEAPLCRINYSHWRMPTWREHLTIMSIHAIDLSRFFMGDPSDGSLFKRSSRTGSATCVLTLAYPSGGTAVLNISANAPHVQEWVEMSGENRMISVHNLVEYRDWAPAPDTATTEATWSDSYTEWRPEFTIPYRQSDSLWLQGYAGELAGFVESVVRGVPVTPSIADAVAAMRLINTIEDAPEGFTHLDFDSGVN